MKRTILLLSIGAALFSCQTKKTILTNDYIQGTSYSGTLPCQDCEGIKQVVILDSGNRFRLAETYLGEEPKSIEKSGSWALQDGKVVLYSDNTALAHYAVAGNNLVYLEEANMQLNKNHSGKGMLARKRFIRSKKIDPNYLEGIDIVAFGAEPSWSLDIHHKKAIQFSLPGLDAPVAFSPVAPRLSGDSIIYQVKTAGEIMEVVLAPGFCSDGVGEYLYDYKVKVSFRGRQYTGCGAVLNADGTLTGTWILETAEGLSKSWEQQPYLVVDLEDERFYGNTGCNNITGSARMRGDKICFSDINYKSQRECNGYDEAGFIEAIIKCNGYTISQGRLEMTQDGRSLLVFRRRLADQP